MSAQPAGAALRCMQHPSRLAHDRCPRCDRPRCAADATRYATAGCAACELTGSRARSAGGLELAVRAGLASLPVVFVGGWIATQYVDVHIFAELLPGLVGLAASLVAQLAVPRHDRLTGRIVLAVAAAAAVLATGLGFRLVPGGQQSVLHPLGVVAAPYLAAVVGAALWPLLFAAPRHRDQSD